MPTANTILDAHTTLRLRCLDRLYLNAYVPRLQRAPLVRRFLEHSGSPIASPALFAQRTKRFVAELRAYATAHGAPWIALQRHERKEEQWRPLCLAAEAAGRSGLVAVGVIQERVRAWRAAKRMLPRGGVAFDFSRGSVFVNQHYLYIADPDVGPAFIKLSGYAPWGGRVYVNGHEWLKRQLAKRGIAFGALDNGLFSCDDPVAAQRIADSFGPDQVDAFFARWMRELPSPLTAEDAAAGYDYALSMIQVEVSDTRVFDRPLRARQYFEALIPEHLALSRPTSLSLLVDRRITRATPGDFRTEVVTPFTLPTLRFRYKHTEIKQYLKQGRALRTETTFNDSYDFAIGRAIRNLATLREKGDAINARLLEVERGTEEARLTGPELTDLVLPTHEDGRRVPALRFGDPRVMALHAALVAIAHQAAGFSNAQLRRLVAALLEPACGEYSSAQMTYDLARLAGHGLVERLPRTHRYRLTEAGLRQCAFLTKLADRVLDPGIARCGAAPPPDGAISWQRFDRALADILRRAGIAA
ncbi:MAG: hypothetical protein EPO40_00785 [Myxococcaceae bacterium]|nr:MAG: hypothetical protein EPO40_00785 [Myxococcaceae bacterium]